MRASQYLLSALGETPADAVIVSHQLLLRAGMIRRLTSGLYAWLPTGLRVLYKIETIVHEGINAAGALKMLMPAVQPAELWQESRRWEQYGPELLRLKDRHEHEFCVGPTHEEVITDLARNELSSYRQLPINFYQIQIKFRDEIHPCFDLIRGHEFIVKGTYSFHPNQYSLQQTYDGIYQTYNKIFSRLDLDFRPMQADGGSIGDSDSHEFRVLVNSDEDDIVFSDSSDYAAGIEKAEVVPRESVRGSTTEDVRPVDTPNIKTIATPVDSFQLPIGKTAETPVVHGAEEGTLVTLIVRGDYELNEIKTADQPLVASPLVFASEAEIRTAIGAGPGSLGPVNLPIACIVDRSIALMSDFVAGANIEDKHYFGVNWEHDLPLPEVADLRSVVEDDPSPDGKGALVIKRGIEVDHVFQLGTKYSEVMRLDVLSEQSKSVSLVMDCYGIDVSRMAAAAIEQDHDERDILWPNALASFQIALIPLKYGTESVKQAIDRFHAELTVADLEVLLNDRDKETSPGVRFAGVKLVDTPHHVVISNHGLNEGVLEYKGCRDSKPQNLPIGELMSFITEGLSH